MGFIDGLVNGLTAIPRTIVSVAGDDTQKEAAKDVPHAAKHALDSPKQKHLSALIRENTGWRGTAQHTAQGVTWAESRGDPKARNYCCTGLMQIHYVHCGTKGLSKDRETCRKELEDPGRNLRVAFALWNETGGRTAAEHWQPWEGYTNGSWRKHTSFDPLINLEDNTVGGAVGDAAEAVIKPFDALITFLTSPDSWFRIGKGLLGGLLVILGVGAIVFIVAQKVQGSAIGKAALKAM
jgi:hypothetical protein